MAFRLPNNYITSSQYVAVGVSIPFNNLSVFNQTFTTVDQIRSNIINFLLTNRGERVLNPTFGFNLENYVYENINPDLTDSLKVVLRSAITSNFPVNVNEIQVNPLPDLNTINIVINYTISNVSQTISITL